MERTEIIKVLKANRANCLACSDGLSKKTRLYHMFMDEAAVLDLVILMLENDDFAQEVKAIYLPEESSQANAEMVS